MGHLDLPFGFDAGGRAATTDDDDHVRDMIRMVLFTIPGERPMRPEFGCGIGSLLFAPLSDTLAAATQHLVQGALLRFLGDRILVEAVDVSAAESTLTVVVRYVRRDTGETLTDSFVREVAA